MVNNKKKTLPPIYPMTDKHLAWLKQEWLEVARLKQEWLSDPHWDIEETKGFEARREELLEFRERVQKEQAELHQGHLRYYSANAGEEIHKLMLQQSQLEERLGRVEEALERALRR